MTAFEALAVATALPASVRDLGGVALYGWAFSGFMLANMLGISAAGVAADRRGAARPFLIGCLLFVAGLVGAGLAPSMAVIVLSRTAQGLGAGAISSITYVAIARAYSASARPTMLAMLSSAWVIPGLIGPGVAGAVADHLGWRWIFLGLAPVSAAASFLAIPSLRRLTATTEGRSRGDQTLAALQLAAGTGIGLWGLASSSVAITAVSIVVGGALAVPALQRLLPAGTLQARPGLPAAVATVSLLSFAFFGTEAFLPLSLTAVRGQSMTVAGITLTAATLSWTAGAWMQARLAARGSRRALVLVGLLLTLAGIAGTAAVLAPTVPVVIAAIAWGVAGLGMGLAYSATNLVVLESAAAGEEGTATAAAQLANVLGVALGTGIGGAVVAVTTMQGQPLESGIGIADFSAVTVALLALVAAARLPDRAKVANGARHVALESARGVV
jgi:MFS family permease